jgi:signal transduction histidine kinase
LAERFLAESVPVRGLRVFDHRMEEAFVTGEPAKGTPFPYTCSIPQWRTEEILYAHLLGLGVEVERGVTAETIDLDEDGVRVECRGPDGQAFSIRADYLVGAGGAHSPVRGALHEHLDGITYPRRYLVADAAVAGVSHDGDRLAVAISPQGMVMVAKLPEGRSLVLTNVPDAAEKIRAINERDQAMRERQKLGHLPHEFRTPLNGILGGIALLRDDFAHLGAEFSETLALVEGSSARLERTLLNYVLHTELAAGRFQPEIPVRVNLAQLVSDSIREEAEKHGRLEDLRFELNDADGELPSQTIRTIVRELASNACKYSDAGSSIRISSGGGLAIIIEDSGRGMTEEEIRQIGPFRQFGRREWEQQGLGLGLAISQRLASASGLTLTIQARDGGGICAGLRLGDGSH